MDELVVFNVLTLRKIFRNLTARQLNTCCRVCKFWNNEAQKEKASRYQMHWNMFVLRSDDKADTALWWNTVNSFISECPIEPVTAWMFCSDSLYSCLDIQMDPSNNESPHKKKRRTKQTEEHCHPVLPTAFPTQCKLHISVSDGVVGTDQDMKTEEYDECQMVMTLMLFGRHWDLQVHPFACNFDQCQDMLQYWAGKKSEIPACFAPLKKLEVKMFNLFCPINGLDQELGYSLFRMFNWPLVAGGNVCSRYVYDGDNIWLSDSSDCQMSGVALSGPSVRVASVLIRSHVDSEEEVDKLMEELASHDLDLECSFGLMYACLGRGVHVYYGKNNVESKVFRKHFPKTPLFGLFGNGEIGCTYPQPDPLHVPAQRKSGRSSSSGSSSSGGQSEDSLDSQSVSAAMVKRQIAERREKDRQFKMKHPPKIMHAYTTVMCLVSIKKQH